MALYILFEAASGYTLLERLASEEIGTELDDVRASVTDFARFSRIVRLHAFQPFTSAENALENINSVSEGIVSDTLATFLEQNLPKVKKIKKAKYKVGVTDHKIGAAIQERLNIPCVSNDLTSELLRGVRLHLPKFIDQLSEIDLGKAQLGLGHSYSRAKVKFNVNRVDNMVIQSICLLDQLDKDLNTFAMRVREWYSWHFPELSRIVSDNYIFARVAKFIGDKSTLTDESISGLEKLTNDTDLAKQILSESRSSMGTDISDIDLVNIKHFTDRVISLAEYRAQLFEYLKSKMSACAPNLATLIGESVGARLISHAGSLTNLAKYPASTVQILGAEKALFRALKTKGNTPKYGLIFHSSFIQRAAAKNKGRISRYLANKCAMAARIDCFSDNPNTIFGTTLRKQVEDRLTFYDTGEPPRPNIEVMTAASKEVALKFKVEPKDEDEEMGVDVKVEDATKSKKKKREDKKAKKKAKKKKMKKEKEGIIKADEDEEPQPEEMEVEEDLEEEGQVKKESETVKEEDEIMEEESKAVEVKKDKKKKKKKKKDKKRKREQEQEESKEVEEQEPAKKKKKKDKKSRKKKKEALEHAAQEAEQEAQKQKKRKKVENEKSTKKKKKKKKKVE